MTTEFLQKMLWEASRLHPELGPSKAADKPVREYLQGHSVSYFGKNKKVKECLDFHLVPVGFQAIAYHN